MKIWVARHGQTNYNKSRQLQGQFDEPLNETGIAQAHRMADMLKDVQFDVVYASPLDRAVKTAMIISGWDQDRITIDKRLIETDFGKYEKAYFDHMGPAMTLYWAVPEIFPAPDTVETVKSMVDRAHSFMRELETKDYENVLIAAHGGILRSVNGYLMDRHNGIQWRPKMHNCEIRVYESVNGVHKRIQVMKGDQ